MDLDLKFKELFVNNDQEREKNDANLYAQNDRRKKAKTRYFSRSMARKEKNIHLPTLSKINCILLFLSTHDHWLFRNNQIEMLLFIKTKTKLTNSL
jgi:hypothetical protein